jgi:uncharacterized protein
VKQDNPLFLMVAIAGVGAVLWMWLGDLRRARQGAPHPRAFPGAQPAAGRAVWLGFAAGLALVAAETMGESVLGLSHQQSTMTLLFGLYTLFAAFGEELVFRGYLVVEGRGRGWLWGSVAVCSVLFAVLHPFLWRWDDGLKFTFDAKGWFSTIVVFVSSSVFYALRFQPWNPRRSLLPCIAAHGAKNVGVIVVKAAQGFIAGWW